MSGICRVGSRTNPKCDQKQINGSIVLCKSQAKCRDRITENVFTAMMNRDLGKASQAELDLIEDYETRLKNGEWDGS